jgi:tetratricopeptide (TPR) repeat protein
LISGQAVLTNDLRRCLANSHFHAAVLLAPRNPSAAAAEFESASQEYRALSRQRPNDVGLQLRLANSHYKAAVARAASDHKSADAGFEAASREYRALVRWWPDDANLQLLLARCLVRKGRYLAEVERLDDAALACEEAAGLCSSSELADDPTIRTQCVDLLRQIAYMLIKAGHTDAAQQRYQQAIDLLVQSPASGLTPAEFHRRLAHIKFQRASCYHHTGRWDKAMAAYSACVEHFERFLVSKPNEETPWWVRSSRKRIGYLQRDLLLWSLVIYM